MTLADLFGGLPQVAGLLFVVTLMLAMGLSLTMAEILQPLRNARLVILALLANFVLVPLLAYGILLLIPLEQSLQIGMIVLATAAGAPFIPKLVQIAKGNIAFSVGLMVLLMVVTIGYMPIALPLLVPGVRVTTWDIGRSLVLPMLVPLAIGLLVKARFPSAAARWQPVMNRLSGLAVLILLVVGLGTNISNIRSLIGTGGILALLFFIVGSFVIGYLLGGREAGDRRVMALGAAQRNVATALVVASQNFTRGNTLSFVLVGAILLLLILLPTALVLGARAASAPQESG